MLESLARSSQLVCVYIGTYALTLSGKRKEKNQIKFRTILATVLMPFFSLILSGLFSFQIPQREPRISFKKYAASRIFHQGRCCLIWLNSQLIHSGVIFGLLPGVLVRINIHCELQKSYLYITRCNHQQALNRFWLTKAMHFLWLTKNPQKRCSGNLLKWAHSKYNT